MAVSVLNKKFGRLIVRGFRGDTGRDSFYAICDCDCGNQTEVYLYSLKNGDTQSCGCYNAEVSKARSTTHGFAGHDKSKRIPEYNLWCSMRRRCNSKPGDFEYPWYAGRGITYCKRWEYFPNFYEDMGQRPKGMTLDRIDVNGNYCPENCRWATMGEQARNKTNNINLTYHGATKCLAEWAREFNIPYKRLYKRIKVFKWDVEKALTTRKRIN